MERRREEEEKEEEEEGEEEEIRDKSQEKNIETEHTQKGKNLAL